MIGKNEIIIQNTQNFEINKMASISVKPFDIHIMHKEFVSNTYDGYIDKKNNVIFAGGKFECDVTTLIEGTTLDDEGFLVDQNGLKYDLTDADVKVEVGLKDIEIIDNEEDGIISGEIVSIIYKGDHYQIIIRTEEDEDFVVDTEWTWNENDKVSVLIPKDKIQMKLVKEAKEYVVD